MDSPASSRASWLRSVLKAVVVLVLAAAAFYAGWSIAQRQWQGAVREAQDAAQQARRQEALAIRELSRALRGMRGLPPPPVKAPLDSPPP
jgi:hypothetical protein